MTREDSLAPERVEPLLTGRFGRPYVYEESCGSTQERVGQDLRVGALVAPLASWGWFSWGGGAPPGPRGAWLVAGTARAIRRRSAAA